jgi:hypothetical protein
MMTRVIARRPKAAEAISWVGIKQRLLRDDFYGADTDRRMIHNKKRIRHDD